MNVPNASTLARYIADATAEFKEIDINKLIFLPAAHSPFGTEKAFIPMDNEGPLQEIYTEAFWLQQNEVSNLEFARFVAQTGFRTDAEKFNFSFLFHGVLAHLEAGLQAEVLQQVEDLPWWVPIYGSNWFYIFGNSSKFRQKNVFEMGLWNHPVIHVSHNDAKAYCEYYGMRLPTEQEFERACYGTKLEPRIYPWGNKLHIKEAGNLVHLANIFQGEFPQNNSIKDGYEFTAPADSFPQTDLDFRNLIGNVWEWVADEWNDKMKVPQNQSFSNHVDESIVERVKKGGSFLCHKSYCYRYRIAARSHNTADTSAQNLGFRCAKSIKEEECTST